MQIKMKDCLFHPFVSALLNMFLNAHIVLLVVFAFDANIAKTKTSAEEISDDIVCGCSAPTYAFVLDFSLSCPPTNITTGMGVSSVSCLISPFGAPTNKLSPVVLDSVSILELDQLNNVLVEERIEGNFFDGDEFSYSSIINEREDNTSVQDIPKAIQLNLSGRNEDGIMLMNVFVITFTNTCGLIPVIQDGESAGWVIFVSFFFSAKNMSVSSYSGTIRSHDCCENMFGLLTTRAK